MQTQSCKQMPNLSYYKRHFRNSECQASEALKSTNQDWFIVSIQKYLSDIKTVLHQRCKVRRACI